MRLLSILLLFFALPLSGTGCDSQKDETKAEGKTVQLEKALSDLQAKQTALLKNQGALQQEINSLKSELSVKPNRKTIASFSPADKDYQIVDTDHGKFYIALDTITRYADGYKVAFSIGNPNNVAFDRVTAKVQWGKAKAANQDITGWMRSLRMQESDINKRLVPAFWNQVIFILPATTESDMGYINISLSPHIALFGVDGRKGQ